MSAQCSQTTFFFKRISDNTDFDEIFDVLAIHNVPSQIKKAIL